MEEIKDVDTPEQLRDIVVELTNETMTNEHLAQLQSVASNLSDEDVSAVLDAIEDGKDNYRYRIRKLQDMEDAIRTSADV